MDVRHPLTEQDSLILNWAAEAQMPVHILLTKADKLKRGPAKASLLKVQATLAHFGDRVSAQLFSAPKRDGLKSLENQLKRWLTDHSVFEPEEDEPAME